VASEGGLELKKIRKTFRNQFRKSIFRPDSVIKILIMKILFFCLRAEIRTHISWVLSGAIGREIFKSSAGELP
jgi:hypothetical protein